ncbi:MAG: hypothetical protein PHD48_11125 [Alphaproteobacteria bacterium]|nr:hypothetical protein [Alphaproteobacteria bacterium]
MNSTDHLYPDVPFSERAQRTAFPAHEFPFNGDGAVLLNQLVPDYGRQAEVISVNFKESPDKWSLQRIDPRKAVLCIMGTIPSEIADGHAVSIRINKQDRTILYKDPYGHSASSSVAKWIKKQFPYFTFQECPIQQQKDNISCSWISLANIVSWLEGKEVNPNIQVGLDDFKYRVLQGVREIWPTIRRGKTQSAECGTKKFEITDVAISPSCEVISKKKHFQILSSQVGGGGSSKHFKIKGGAQNPDNHADEPRKKFKRVEGVSASPENPIEFYCFRHLKDRATGQPPAGRPKMRILKQENKLDS